MIVMTACEKYVCKWVLDFVDQNWDKMDHKKCDLNSMGKVKLMKDVKRDPQWAMWVITEVMNWAMDKNYHDDLQVFPKVGEDDTEDFRVIKLGDKYIKYVYNKDYTYTVTFTEPKTKSVIVTYYE